MLKYYLPAFVCFICAFLCVSSSVVASPTVVIVHEWGTITTCHQPNGTPEGRLNRIEQSEVLPSFVHKFEPPQTQGNPSNRMMKTVATPGRPDVTMRLETPVIYFYPGEDYQGQKSFEVEVSFRGGVINEFFPNASASVSLDSERIQSKMQAGVIHRWNGEALNNYVRGSIVWSIANLPLKAKVPQTEESVWTAPRKVGSRYVETSSGECEKYLFYRGVAHLEAMLQTRSSDSQLTLLSPKHLHWLPSDTTVIPKAWIVDINEQGKVAFRTIESITLQKNSPAITIESFPPFTVDQFRPENLTALKDDMKKVLVAQGLFQKEAEAMLATWNESYFEKAGRRIFYIVPLEWLDYHLPVKIGIPHILTRVFIGRIDLIDKKGE